MENSTAPGESTAARPIAALLGGLFVGGFGLAFGSALTLLVAGVLVFGLGVDLSITGLLVLALIFTQGVGCGGIALAYVKLRPRATAALRRRLGDRPWLPNREFSIPASLPSLRDLLYVAGGYVLALGAALVGSIALASSGVEAGNNQVAELGLENPELLLLLVPASILLIGPGEELLFRGVVQGRIREAFGPVAGIALASAIFAGVHYFALTGGTGARLASIGVLFLPSLVFGAAYELSENIAVPSLIHGLYNATLFAGLYVATQMPELTDPALLVG